MTSARNTETETETETYDLSEGATFGAGGTEPYAAALRRSHSNVLYLHETDDGATDDRQIGGSERRGAAPMDVSRWHADADVADLSLLRSVTGPVLDIGCGPGRMVRAAMDLGIEALGIDVSPTAIEVATESGLSVLLGSVFEALPLEGKWQTTLLVDGNIGIGGDVTAMLARCDELIAADGEIVVETHPDAARDRTYTGRLVDTHGRQSDPFPWAEIGVDALIACAAAIGLASRQVWQLDGRTFCRLARQRHPKSPNAS
ncbi:SAM-dependent methyltransferase [Marisediminicola sp. UYEF4]|uniref:class I SAM-dependent methyltransferase n=1 Tax=Marisediminicola sp. UYEF4 TaxID=1756384 RepID=UPI0033937DDF